MEITTDEQVIPYYCVAHNDRMVSEWYARSQSVGLNNFAERVAYISQQFLGRPYLTGAQGEGPDAEFDQSPLFRFDKLDCLTYVNNVLALAYSNHLNGFKKQLLKLNYYDAEPTYQNRFHFMSLDWNVQNQKNGLLTDITTKIVDDSGNPIAQVAEGDIDRPAWFEKKTLHDLKLLKPLNESALKERLTALRNIALKVKKEKAQITYLSLTELFDAKGNPKQAIFNQIPQSAIIEIVRPNWDLVSKIGTCLHVSHVGFAIRHDDGTLYFRHASLLHQRVEEVSLARYLHERLHSPTIRGINVEIPIAQ